MWTRQFLYVPPGDLTVRDLRPSPKHSHAEIDRWLERLQEVDHLLQGGADYHTLQRLREHPPGSWERELWQAYHHAHDPTSHTRIRAAWSNGRLEVDNGRHRVARAQQLGVAELPVEVAAPQGPPSDALRRRYTPVDERHRRARDYDASRHRAEQRQAEQRRRLER